MITNRQTSKTLNHLVSSELSAKKQQASDLLFELNLVFEIQSLLKIVVVTVSNSCRGFDKRKADTFVEESGRAIH